VIVAQAIQRGELRDPERLMGFVRTVVRRQVAAHIDGAIETRKYQTEFDPAMTIADRTATPEQSAIDHEHQDVAMRILRSIPQRDREILVRFYLQEQTPAQICKDMELSETQFRLIKSRAKARFGELAKRRLERKGITRFT
jgi:RNA polymerase sigma factor (sigma-70 family)